MGITQGALFNQPRLTILNEDQMERIHSASLEVLERVGVKMTHPRGLELMESVGCRIAGDRVHIPSWVVEDAIGQAPSRVVLGNRKGERAVVLEGRNSYFGPSLDCIDYLNPADNSRSRFTADHCRITPTIAASDATLPKLRLGDDHRHGRRPAFRDSRQGDRPPDHDLLSKALCILLQRRSQRKGHLRDGPGHLRGQGELRQGPHHRAVFRAHLAFGLLRPGGGQDHLQRRKRGASDQLPGSPDVRHRSGQLRGHPGAVQRRVPLRPGPGAGGQPGRGLHLRGFRHRDGHEDHQSSATARWSSP